MKVAIVGLNEYNSFWKKQLCWNTSKSVILHKVQNTFDW